MLSFHGFFCCQALEWELKALVKGAKAQRREERAKKDTVNIDNWVGADVWRAMVRKSMQGLTYIHNHRDDVNFFNKSVHQLANQFIGVIIFLNSFPGRCGGWELFSKEEMVLQLAKEEEDDILTFFKHKTVKVYGPTEQPTQGASYVS